MYLLFSYVNLLSKMKSFDYFGKHFRHLYSSSCVQISCCSKSFRALLACLFRFLVFQLNLFWIQVCYLVLVSFVGFLLLKAIGPKDTSHRPTDFDVFFTSVSAVTISSMATVEMEVFSNAQLVILTVLILISGEVFISMLGLQLRQARFRKQERNVNKVDSVSTEMSYVDPNDFNNCIELGLAPVSEFGNLEIWGSEMQSMGSEDLKYTSIRYLAYVVLGYLLVVHGSGSLLVLTYVSLVSSARDVLNSKGLQRETFSVFTTVSSFANCGFVPTNEGMAVFKQNSGLLLLLIPQIVLGNTLYPSCLRLIIWVLRRFTKRVEFDYMLKNPREIDYGPLLSDVHSKLLAATVFGFILVQLILFCSLEWSSVSLNGLNSYQKIVGALSMAVNSRHAGESLVDISLISPALLVLFVVMMYLPPYTCFIPVEDDEKSQKNSKRGHKRTRLVRTLVFSQLSYLVIFIILVCITEREKMSNDPLNFNISAIITEVISAYGNVGFSTGYSCQRQMKPNGNCKDAWYGFVGRWSNKGKLILIFVMFFGRLKKFNRQGGEAWKLIGERA